MRLRTRAWGIGPASLLLIHGLGDGAFVWEALLSRLRNAYAGVMVDLRGHGDSPWDERGAYDADAHAEDVVRVLDELDPRAFVLVGHSLGAEVAVRVGAKRPGRLAGLVLLDGGPELEARAAQVLQAQMTALFRSYDSPAQLEEVLGERHPFADLVVLKEYAAAALRTLDHGGYTLRCDPAVFHNLAAQDSAAIWAMLKTLSCPKLLMRGAASSFLTLRQATRIAQNVPQCRWVTVPRAGHSIALDNPGGVHAALSPFLEEVSPSDRA